MKYLSTLFLLSLSFHVLAQNWESREPFPFNSTRVQRVDVTGSTYCVITIDEQDSLQYQTTFDEATGTILNVEQVETRCGSFHQRVAPLEYIQETFDRTGFTLTRVRYDNNCQATVLYSKRFDLGPVGESVDLGQGMYDESLDAYFVYGLKLHDTPSNQTPYQQFIYQIDPEDGMILRAFEQQDTSYSAIPSARNVLNVIPNLGLYTQIQNSRGGHAEFTSFDSTTTPFDRIATGWTTSLILESSVNANGDFAYMDFIIFRDYGAQSIHRTLQNEIVNVSNPYFFRRDTSGAYPSYHNLHLAENGDLLAIGRLLPDIRAGSTTEGAFVYRMTSDQDSVVYRFISGSDSPLFTHITSTPSRGLFAAGTFGGDLFVIKMEDQLSGLFDKPSETKFTLYPNPAINFVHISTTEVLAQAEPYAIYESTGGLIKYGILSDDSSISVNDLPAGQYAITLPRLNAVAQIVVQ